MAGSDSVPEQLLKDIQPETRVVWYLGDLTARGIYDLPPGVDPVAAIIQKWREALLGNSPIEVLSIDSHGDRDANATMFISALQVSGFKVFREIKLTAAVA